MQTFGDTGHNTLNQTTQRAAGLNRHAGSGGDASRSRQGRGVSSFIRPSERRCVTCVNWVECSVTVFVVVICSTCYKIRGRDVLWFQNFQNKLWEKQQSTLLAGLRVIFPQLWCPTGARRRLGEPAIHRVLLDFNRAALGVLRGARLCCNCDCDLGRSAFLLGS